MKNQKTLKEKFRELIKQRLFKALVLIILAFFSFLIQQTVNPEIQKNQNKAKSHPFDKIVIGKTKF